MTDVQQGDALTQRTERPVERLLNLARGWKRDLIFFGRWLGGRRTPRCGYLSSSLFIDSDGSIYACCHNAPWSLGNIYAHDLAAVWNGGALKKARRQNALGMLRCAEKCNLLVYGADPEPEKRGRAPVTVPLSRLEFLATQFSYACNVRCIMCKQDHANKRELDAATLIDKIDYTHIRHISIQGGEPLFIKNARTYFEWLAEKGIKVYLLTNGTIMNERMASLLMSNGNTVHVSLNGATASTHERINKGSRWEKVIKNLEMLKAARARCPDAEVQLLGHMTIVPENLREVPLFIEKMDEFGFDRVNFTYDEAVPAWLKKDLEETEGLRQQIASTLANSRYRERVDTSYLRGLGLVS